MSQPQPVSFQSHPGRIGGPYFTRGKILGLVLGILIVGGVGILAYSQYTAFQSKWVTLSGTAQTSFTAKVTWIQFTQYTGFCSPGVASGYGCPCPQYERGGSCYSSYHAAPVNNGKYSTIIEKDSGWTVFLVYENPYTLYCYAGDVSVRGVSGTYIINVRC